MSFVRLGSRALRPCMVALAVMSWAVGTASADIIIDDFTSVGSPNPWPASQTGPGNNLVTEVNLTNVLGNVRQTTVFGESFKGGVVSANIQSGRLTYTSSPGADGALSLFYTGFPGGLNANFTNELGIQLDFTDFGFFGRSSGDGGSANVIVDIFNGSKNANLTRSLSGFGPQSLFFDFKSFNNISALDLSTINRITVSINPLGSDLDFQLDRVFTVTIPAPGVLALLGVAGVVSRRRRRR